MNKIFNRIIFENGTTPAINEANLNAITKAIDDIDDRVVELADDTLVAVPEVKEAIVKVETELKEANEKLPIMKDYADSAEASADEAKEWSDKAEEWAKTAHTTEVIVTPLITSGLHIADISVNGNVISIYCSGGGGGGTTSYNELEEATLPKINNVMLKGDLTLDTLGIASAQALSDLASLVGTANATLEEV